MEKIKCLKCKELKPLNDFTKNKSKKLGFNNVCKECHSKYRKEHYLKNKDRVINQVNKYRNENPEKYLKINKFLKKAGRTFEIRCRKCDNILFVTKKEYDNGIKKYCSRECQKTDNKSPYHYYLKNLKARAIKKNKEFNLTEEFLKELLEIKQNNKCAVCNVNIFIKHPNEISTIHDTASLDRIDNNRGYTKDNVRWVALGINYMRLDFNNNELHTMLKLIKENYTPLA